MSSNAKAPCELYPLQCQTDRGIITAIVSPHWGANIVAMAFRPTDLAWPIPVLEAVGLATVFQRPTSYGCPILAPSPGRVGRNQCGRFEYKGVRYEMKPGRHGFLRDVAWQVESYSESDLVCSVQIQEKGNQFGNFPFRFEAAHAIRLSDTALRSSIRITSKSSQIQPINVGWHPYLHRSGPCQIRIPASKRWILTADDEPIPTGELTLVQGLDDFRRGRELAIDEHWDDVFTALEVQDGVVDCWVEEQVSAIDRSGTPCRVSVRRTVQLPWAEAGALPVKNVQIYTPPGRNAISIEPLSSPPNAINLLASGNEFAGVCELGPGESARWDIEIGIAVNVLPST